MHFIFITQVYPPDPAAVGQYFEDAAVELGKRGHRVTVYTADRDYDNPRIRYDASSRHPSVRLKRIPFSSFGKRTILHRLVGQASFLCQCMLRLLFRPKPDVLVLTTIPATTGMFFLAIQWIKRFKYVYWVMDINPDQAVALGVFSEKSLPAKILAAANRQLLRGAARVVCLDQDMSARINATLHPQVISGRHSSCDLLASSRRDSFEEETLAGKLSVIPPWPLEEDLEQVPKQSNPFVEQHNLEDHFVFMYSGNHSLVHPLTTILDGMEEAAPEGDVAYAFVGGGRGKETLEQRRRSWVESSKEAATRGPDGQGLSGQVLSLPYQPLNKIKYSLSAADVHFVVQGESMVGIVHPCKLYSAMATGKAVLFVGPQNSALGKVVSENQIGWCVAHGGVGKMAELLTSIPLLPEEQLREMGARARELAATEFSRVRLCGEFCDILEVSAQGK